MTNDRTITISAGSSRRATSWTSQTMLLSELWARLQTPVRGTETMAEYLGMKKPQQDDLKDVGGFVAGTLSGPRRKAGAVTGRDILTLDLDSIPAGGTQEVLRRVDGLGCGYCVYSTRKHRPEAPRLRVLLPLDRTATADEYEPLARRMAQYIGLEWMDPSTFEASRLMYWPSCCAGSPYVYTWQDKPLLSADGLLAQYQDWRDCAQWPQVPGAVSIPKLAAKQGDPEGKKGVVGAFCRVYDVYRAMEELLPGVYQPVDGMPDRYTYLGGSTTGGAVVYDSGKFLYSHHATDPCSGRLVNAFDLVRLHRFGELDDGAQPGSPANRLPSYAAMCELAVQDTGVAALMSQERYQEAVRDFAPLQGQGPVEPAGEEDPSGWMAKLEVKSTGEIAKTADNILLILENDPILRGRIATDTFASRGLARGPFPWDPREAEWAWSDNDDSGLRWYLEKAYRITGKEKTMDALSICGNHHAFDPVREYLTRLTWDGVPRLDTLFVDYLGAADTPYTRAAARKSLTAAVARAMTPGCKYDTMTILTGPQGIGKSTLLRKLGRKWFSDSLTSFVGKEARELVQGVWIIEVGELTALSQAENNQAKQFLSQCEDIFRAAYGRRTLPYPRRCVFFGTSNTHDYLRDKTGGRRFWPVDVGAVPAAKNVFTQLDGEIDQIWAEALMRFQVGELLYMEKGIQAEAARGEQESHRERSPWEGVIQDFLERPVPEDWQSWPLDRRKIFWAGGVVGELPLVSRERVCALEVWCEALNGDPLRMRRSDAHEINGVLASTEGWQREKKVLRFGYCGVQRGFTRG